LRRLARFDLRLLDLHSYFLSASLGAEPALMFEFLIFIARSPVRLLPLRFVQRARFDVRVLDLHGSLLCAAVGDAV
jgi:hypothetical protein